MKLEVYEFLGHIEPPVLRWSFARDLELTNKNDPKWLATVAVKASKYKIQMTAEDSTDQIHVRYVLRDDDMLACLPYHHRRFVRPDDE